MKDLEHKYNINDNVIFFDTDKCKLKRGKIIGVNAYKTKEFTIVKYDILTDSERINVGRFVPESLIFSNRDDALDWAIKITDEL